MVRGFSFSNDRNIQGLRNLASSLTGRVATTVTPPTERMKQDAQNTAPWQDQTGRARSGLNSGVEIDGTVVTVYLQHDPNLRYPIYLETKYEGRDGVILGAMTRAIPDFEDAMRHG